MAVLSYVPVNTVKMSSIAGLSFATTAGDGSLRTEAGSTNDDSTDMSDPSEESGEKYPQHPESAHPQNSMIQDNQSTEGLVPGERRTTTLQVVNSSRAPRSRQRHGLGAKRCSQSVAVSVAATTTPAAALALSGYLIYLAVSDITGV
jgi:hypothetical protein